MTDAPLIWRVAGTYFEACNCEAVCPCRREGGRMGGRSTYGRCDFALSWRVTEGQAGATGTSSDVLPEPPGRHECGDGDGHREDARRRGHRAVAPEGAGHQQGQGPGDEHELGRQQAPLDVGQVDGLQLADHRSAVPAATAGWR